MPRRTRTVVAFCAAVAIALLISACGGGVPGTAIATVGGATISKASFNHWMVVADRSNYVGTTTAPPPTPVPPHYTNCVTYERAAAAAAATSTSAAAPTVSAARTECAQAYASLNQSVVQFLVQSVWLQGEAVDRKIRVTTKQADSELATLKAQEFPTATAFKTFLAQSGETVPDLKWRVYINMLQNAIKAKAIKKASKVTPAQLRAYYNAHRSTFGTPARRDIHLILVSDAATANKVKSLLAGGASYATIAPKYSIDPSTKAAGGVLDGVQPGEESSAFSTAIFSGRVGVLSGPVKTPFGYYVFTVDSITAATQKSFSAAQSAVRAALVAQRQQATLAQLATGLPKKWSARTTCAKGFIVSNVCRNAPKSSATGSSGATTGATGASAATG